MKSLLLGSAAGVVAMAGAQAADLPVKAKPVEYVKICSLYGAGFYYVPGTDMCLKIGGWVRAEYVWGQNGNFAWGWGNGNVNNRATNNSDFRARGYITADARNQTEYGTVRSYIAVGLSTNDLGLNTAANQFSANRAFIQLAGFTFGISQSFFDFYSVPATSLPGAFPSSDTGDPGWTVFGYTAQFGNGLSASLSAEERRMTQLININSGVFATTTGGTTVPGGYPTASPGIGGVAPSAGGYGGYQAPDIVANLRIDQTWGSAQIMGALHEVNPMYYGGGTVTSGHPSDTWGFAAGAGAKFFVPAIGAGDYFQTQVNYTQGALRYVFFTPNSNWGKVAGFNEGYGVLADGVYGGTIAAGSTNVQLATAWNVNAAYEHYWSKQWKTSAYGGYAAVTYGGLGNALLCNVEGQSSGSIAGGNLAALPGCNNNWQTWWLGSRTQWNVSPDTYLALDVLYSKLHSGQTANSNGALGSNLAIGNALFVSDMDN